MDEFLTIDAPPIHTPLTTSRVRLVAGDPDRNFVYLSTRDGSLGQFKFSSQPIARTQLCYGEDGTDPPYHGGLTIPATTPPGTYTIDAGRGPELTVTVVAAPTRKVTTVSTFAAFQQVVRLGYLDVTLAPGRYDWPAPVTLPANFVLRGDGATIRRQPVTNLGTNWPALVIGGNDVSVYGCTFNYDAIPAGGMVFFANPSASGLVAADCTFRRCNFGFYLAAAFVRDCRFDSAGAVIAPGGLWLRCVFTGPPTIDPWQFWGPGSVQMIDCVFRDTSRGPVFNAAGGPISDCLFVGTRISGVNDTANGNEVFLCEAGPINRSLFLHTRMYGCLSTAYQWDGGADGNLVSDHAQDGGMGVYWNGYDTNHVVRNCTIRSSEFQRCGFYCGPFSDSCSLTDSSVVAFANSRGNQSWPNPSPWIWRMAACLNEGLASNTLSRVKTRSLSPGYTDQIGFTVVP